MVDSTHVVDGWTGYWRIAAMWVRASMTYRVSFWMMTVAGFVIGALDFIGIWILFHTIDSMGGFSLREVAFLYGATGIGLAFADMFVGRIERLGQMIRMGDLDTMMVRPVPLLAQVCSNEFALRRLSRILLCTIVTGWASLYVEWTPMRLLVMAGMLTGGAAIFCSIFVMLACIQFLTADGVEFANAFTYGGNTITQYPLAIFPGEVVKALTFVLPLAFVNWYPALFILGRDDPFGMPQWFQFLSLLVGAAMLWLTTFVWRSGVRHYRSTGS
ncbi:ABC transporter permease [Nocardioides sp. Root151]|uniref:ABC transporter permease n=1 Tax=Nocardioides sp. Root151 TaxID=1736475 RepID=UPI00070306AD|nr:ABC transporter permease [Nocardioides sp. Root151]KQZ70317.1 transporter [Nocardioides sp. Root151]